MINKWLWTGILSSLKDGESLSREEAITELSKSYDDADILTAIEAAADEVYGSTVADLRGVSNYSRFFGDGQQLMEYMHDTSSRDTSELKDTRHNILPKLQQIEEAKREERRNRVNKQIREEETEQEKEDTKK